MIFFWGAKCLVIFFGGNLNALVAVLLGGSSKCLDESIGGNSFGWQLKMSWRISWVAVWRKMSRWSSWGQFNVSVILLGAILLGGSLKWIGYSDGGSSFGGNLQCLGGFWVYLVAVSKFITPWLSVVWNSIGGNLVQIIHLGAFLVVYPYGILSGAILGLLVFWWNSRSGNLGLIGALSWWD